jgi:transglutaminase-like putative cysteine protease
MRFEISHITEYRYAEAVTLSPHYLRLRPREDGTVRLLDFRLHLEPQAATVTLQAEADGNVALVTWFNEPVRLLRIHTESVVETARENPFDYIISEPSARTLPVRYNPALQAVLAPSLAGSAGPTLRKLAEELAAETSFDTLRFLNALNLRLFESTRVIVRKTGAPLDPEECLTLGEGACRDLAMVFAAACRHMGIAARFVSGYQMMDPESDEKHMHAWAEVFLPGGGWRGFDPTHGIAVDQHFVPVAASPDPQLVTPIEGYYSPASVASTLSVSLDVRSFCSYPAASQTSVRITQ